MRSDGGIVPLAVFQAPTAFKAVLASPARHALQFHVITTYPQPQTAMTMIQRGSIIELRSGYK